MRDAKLLLNNFSGKPEDIYLFIGRYARAAFGNSMATSRCWSTRRREADPRWRCWCCTTTPPANNAYDPTEGLPDSKVGIFTQSLYDEANAEGWTVISMKKDWKQIFAWEK